MILLVMIILFPLGFVINQIFYAFYIQQAQEETLQLSTQYASLINDSSVENRMEVVEVAARMSNQKLLILEKEGELWANANMNLSSADRIELLRLLNESSHSPLLTNSFQTTDGVTYLATSSHIEVDGNQGHVIMFASLERILQSMQTVQYLIFISVVGSLLVGIGLAYFLSRKLSQPLINMEQAARKIARGELDTRVEERSKDEVGSLAGAINDLAANLSRINKQRVEFYANISHELQTPITYLKGYAKVLRKGLWKTEEEKDRYLTIIEEEANRLSYLVNDLFDLAKMDDGRFKLKLEKVALEQLIKQVLQKTAYRALEKGLSLRLESDSLPGLFVMADPLRMEQVLLNIVENAIRYTEEGEIVISVKSGAGQVQIIIKDTGKGIPKEEVAYLFERFYRVEKSRSREYGGTGLGLTIVKQLIELHRGTVSIDSEVGQGTIVTLSLPEVRRNKREDKR